MAASPVYGNAEGGKRGNLKEVVLTLPHAPTLLVLPTNTFESPTVGILCIVHNSYLPIPSTLSLSLPPAPSLLYLRPLLPALLQTRDKSLEHHPLPPT